MLPVTAGRAGRHPSSPLIHGRLQLPLPWGASAAPSVQWEEEAIPYRHIHTEMVDMRFIYTPYNRRGEGLWKILQGTGLKETAWSHPGGQD